MSDKPQKVMGRHGIFFDGFRRFMGDPRPIAIIAIGLFVFSLGGLFFSLIENRSALITGDPFSYLLFAQELAQGQVQLTGPLADAIATFSDSDELRQGPIWNTNVLPGGKAVFTVAVGYPLFLAAAFQLGGVWLYTHVNVVLLLLTIIILVYCVWEGFGKSLQGFLIGSAVSLLFVHSHPETFIQFSQPWREPLFYICVLGGIAGLLRFSSGGRVLSLGIAGLLLGYACAIKEANAIYAMWLGLSLVISKSWRQHPNRINALAIFVGCGLIGIAPLLWQNAVATGSPLQSLQFLRATSNYSAPDVAAGLNRNNAFNTISRYLVAYQSMALFHPLWLLAALLGLLSSLRRPVGRLFFGVLVVHLLLYLQWGNADFRHMLFAHIPYCLFVVSGLVWLLALPLRWWPSGDRYRNWLVGIPLAVIAFWPSPWPRRTTPGDLYAYEHAMHLVSVLRQDIGERSILLSNRMLRDVIGIYGGFSVVRLHDLAIFHPHRDYQAVINWFRQKGNDLYFLDNSDCDPSNVGRVDWSLADREWLLEYNNLERMNSLDREEYRLDDVTLHDQLNLYKVVPWVEKSAKRLLPVPKEGAAFLYIHTRSASDLSVRLNDRIIHRNLQYGYYQPIHDLDLAGQAVLSWQRDDVVPGLADARLISWNEVIRQPCGLDSSPSDQFLFPLGVGQQRDENCRRFKNRFTVRAPIRQRSDLFTTVGLSLTFIEDETNATVSAEFLGGEPKIIKVEGLAAWFPVIQPNLDEPVAKAIDITIRSDADSLMKLSRVKSFSAQRTCSFRPTSLVSGVGLRGRLVPDVAGKGPHPWSVLINGQTRQSGECLDDPRRSMNAFQWLVSGDDLKPACVVEFKHCGLIQAEWVPIEDRLEIRPGKSEEVFIAQGIYPTERSAGATYAWTTCSLSVKVPVVAGLHHYRLQLSAADGHPEKRRPLLIYFLDTVQTIELSTSPNIVSLEFFVNDPAETGLVEMVFEIEPWIPREVLGYDDDRSLGFMLSKLIWEPIHSNSRPVH